MNTLLARWCRDFSHTHNNVQLINFKLIYYVLIFIFVLILYSGSIARHKAKDQTTTYFSRGYLFMNGNKKGPGSSRTNRLPRKKIKKKNAIGNCSDSKFS